MRYFGQIIRLALVGLLAAWSCLPPLSARPAWAQDRPQAKRILILNSFPAPNPWESTNSKAFRATLAASRSGPFDISEEPLDLSSVSGPRRQGVLLELLRAKYAGQKLDLVIAVNNLASGFLIEHGRKLFPGTPKIISGGGEEPYGSPPRQHRMTGIFIEEDILGCLRTALELLPASKQVFVVGGSGPYGQSLLAQARKQLSALGPSPRVTYLSGQTVEELRERVAKLPPDSLLLYLMVAKDKSGRPFVPREVCRQLSREANAPLLGVYDTFLGAGILGGRLASAEAMGRTLGRVALRILGGEDPEKITPVPVPSITAFDWRQLKRWGLLNAPLPAGAQVRYRQYSYWQKHWRLILLLVLVLVVQSVLIALLLNQRRRGRAEEQKRFLSETALVESEQRYRQMFEHDRVVQWLVDPRNGAVVAANQAACQYYGYSHEELTARKIFDINLEGRELVAEKLEAVENSRAVSFLARHRLASGEVREVEVYSSPLTLQGRTLLHSSIFDVTERKRAEEALRQSESQFRTLVENAPLAILIQTGGLIRYVNNQGIAAFGAQEQGRLLGQPVLDRVPEKFHQEILARIKKVNEDRQPLAPFEYQYLRLDGTVFDVEVMSVPFEYEGQNGALVFFRDISQKIKDQAEKSRLESQLYQSQKMEALGTLAGGIAHDFNNLLGVMIGFAEMSLDEVRRGELPEARDLRQVLAAGERARELIQQILTFSRKVEMEGKPLALNAEVERTVQLLERTLPKMVGIETCLAKDLSPVMANSQQLEQILLNLTANARQAMPEGGRLTIETRNVFLDQDYCSQHLECKPGPHVMLRVSDNGHGMDEQTRAQIFDPFFTTKGVGEGTGLGLSTVFGLVKGFGGYISCYSEPELGTTFTIYLPALREESVAASGATLLPDLLPGGAESILVVDDERALRELSRRILNAAGYQVVTAESGEEALELYRAQGQEIDLVLMDLSMPGMGGHKALQSLLEMDPLVKVVIASGYAVNGSVKDAMRAGAADFVAKPFQKADLLCKVRQVLDRA